MKNIVKNCTLAFALSGSAAMASETCGAVTIAEMNWASAGVLAQVDRLILESGYGCEVEMVAGDTGPTFASMAEKGQPDLAPEMWVHGVREALETAVEESRIVVASQPLRDGSQEGWWIPTYIATEHEIYTVEDALAHPELFPGAEDTSKGALFNCPAGWNCQMVTENYFRAYEAEAKGFELVDSGSAAGLDGSIARAFERKEGWFGYYWAPTAMLSKYDMTLLDGNVPADEEEWERCSVQASCADPKVNGWLHSEVVTLVTARFLEEASVAMSYVKARSWNNATVGAIMVWMSENQATNEDGAYHFLETYPQVWEEWVPADAAEKIKSNL